MSFLSARCCLTKTPFPKSQLNCQLRSEDYPGLRNGIVLKSIVNCVNHTHVPSWPESHSSVTKFAFGLLPTRLVLFKARMRDEFSLTGGVESGRWHTIGIMIMCHAIVKTIAFGKTPWLRYCSVGPRVVGGRVAAELECRQRCWSVCSRAAAVSPSQPATSNECHHQASTCFLAAAARATDSGRSARTQLHSVSFGRWAAAQRACQPPKLKTNGRAWCTAVPLPPGTSFSSCSVSSPLCIWLSPHISDVDDKAKSQLLSCEVRNEVISFACCDS